MCSTNDIVVCYVLKDFEIPPNTIALLPVYCTRRMCLYSIAMLADDRNSCIDFEERDLTLNKSTTTFHFNVRNTSSYPVRYKAGEEIAVLIPIL